MPIDPSIYGHVLTPQEEQQQVYRNQLLGFQTQQAMHQMQAQNALLQMFRAGATPGNMTSQQLQQLWAIDPQFAMQLQQQQGQRQLQQSEVFKNVATGREMDARSLQQQQQQFEAKVMPIRQMALLKYQDVLSQTGDPKAAIQAAQEAYSSGLSSLPTGMFGPSLIQRAQAWRFNPDLVRAQVYGKALNAKQVEGGPAPTRNRLLPNGMEQQEQWDYAQSKFVPIGPPVPRFKPTNVRVNLGGAKGWNMLYDPDNNERYRVNATTGAVLREMPDGTWAPDNTVNIGSLKKVGGSSSGFGSSLNQRFVNRVAGAGNEGAAALITIAGMKDPSSGLFSMSAAGGGPGKSLAKAFFTPDRIKMYNSSVAGLAPEIAAAQNQGLAPNDAQIQSIEQAITIGPTDDLKTQRFKVAVAARYLRNALEVAQTLGTPDQKKQIAGIMKQLAVFPDPNAILGGQWQEDSMYQGVPLTTSPQQRGQRGTTPPTKARSPSKGLVSAQRLQEYATKFKMTPQAAAAYLQGQGYEVQGP